MAQTRLLIGLQLQKGVEGDIVFVNASLEQEYLPIGTTDQVLRVVAGLPTWDDILELPAGTGAGDMVYFDGVDWIVLPNGNANEVLVMNGTGTAPVWTPQATLTNFDITDGSVTQTVNDGETITFADDAFLKVAVSATNTVTVSIDPAGDLADLLTGTLGDILYYDGNAWVSLPIGSNGNVLVVTGGLPSWTASVSAISFTLSDGTTTQGIADGDTLLVVGGEGISVAVTATDTLTINSTDTYEEFTPSAAATTVTIVGTIDANVPIRVYRNGQRMREGVGNDWTRSGNTITFLTAFIADEWVVVDYYAA